MVRCQRQVRLERLKRSTPFTPPDSRWILTVRDPELFERLRAFRRELAEERGVPAYVVFSDATLVEMATLRPRTLGGLSQISGVGPAKLSRYGEAVLNVILRSR